MLSALGWFRPSILAAAVAAAAFALHPGYQQCSYQRADVSWGIGMLLSPDYASLDSFMDDTERFHRFHFVHRLDIVACRSWSDFHGFVPFIEGELVGALTLESGTVIYVTPRIEIMHYSTAEFLRHELSHALILQNAPLASRARFKKAPWLYEGLAVLAADQKAYGSASDFLKRARTEEFVPLFDPAAFERPGFDLRMAYRTWRYFLEDLIEVYGRDRFQVLLARFMLNPTALNTAFLAVYGESVTAAVRAFEKKVADGDWAPAALN